MGNQEVWEEQDGSLLNGLLPNEASRVTRILEADRWSVAEARIEELIRCIQPNPRSEDCRNAVVNYVQRLITKCFSCQVFTFGSVPLKTYLPDGDIDMSAFSNNLSMKDTWANEVRDMLENEEKSENAELRVKEVQYIQAEVKIIKCLVENIVVDISFNQLGGLCTLCFLEEIDQFINQDHLFKRSIILIKAWCYYESRILGAHHGLISTYALEILVLYIFHVFNNSFTGPLEVLYRFLEFFSNFDWDNFCVSLWGPVPVSSLPDVSAEPPRKDAGELLLNKYFLDNCSSRYSVSPGSQENQGQPFISKFFNVIDPLRTNNNLGRSVSKGNFFRIRSAFAFGAKRLAGLLECPKDDVISELNMFFSNTWRRHGSGERPDAPGLHLWSVQPSERMGSVDERSKNPQNQSELRPSENHGSVLSQEHQTDAGMSSQGIYRPGSLTSGSRLQSRKTYGSQTISRASDQTERNARSSIEQPVQGPRVPKTSSRPSYASSESEAAGKFQFSRTRSSPELSDASSVTSGQRQSKPETVKSYMTSSRQEISSHSSRFTASDSSDLNSSSNQSLEIAADSSRSYHNDSGFVTSSEDFGSISEALMRQQEEQDMVNMMASSTIGGINGQVQLPLNMPSALPFPLPPSMLASMGDSLKNLAGILPANIPLIGPHGGSIMQFSHGFPSSPLPRYFHGTGLAPNLDEIADPGHEGSGTRDLTLEDDNGLWPDQTESGPRGSTPDRRSFQRFRSDDRHLNSVGTDNSGNAFMRGQPKFVKDNRLASVDGQETNSTDVASSSRFMANAQASSSSRNKSFSENSKLARDKRGRKSTPSASYVASKRGQQYEESSSVHSEVDEHNDWIPLSVMGSEVGGERTMVPSSLPLSLPHGHHLTGFDPGQVFVSPSGSQSRTGDGAGVMPFAFYATGPPVPFLTMLPFCNFPSESGNFDGSVSTEDNTLDNGHLNPSDSKNFDLGENLEHLDALSSPGSAKGVSFEHLEEHKRDILNSDFLGHLQNLQYGRFCQDTHYPGPLVYPSPMVFPPMYLQGHFPWDGPGRPLSTNMNVFPVASYGPRLVPVPSTQLGQSRQQTGVFQRYGDEIPRYRGGTGTYLPNPKPSSYRDRQPTRPRNHRGNYSYERSDHADRDTSWTGSKSSRATNRNHGRTQVEKSTLRTDRPPAPDNRPNRSWDSFRNESAPAYQAQISKPGPSSLPPGAHPLAGSSNGAGPAVPSVMMLYSYEGGRADFGSSELLEFGSLRQVHLEGPRSTERGQLRGSPRSSPEQPSSPQVHRRGV